MVKEFRIYGKRWVEEMTVKATQNYAAVYEASAM